MEFDLESSDLQQVFSNDKVTVSVGSVKFTAPQGTGHFGTFVVKFNSGGTVFMPYFTANGLATLIEEKVIARKLPDKSSSETGKFDFEYNEL